MILIKYLNSITIVIVQVIPVLDWGKIGNTLQNHDVMAAS